MVYTQKGVNNNNNNNLTISFLYSNGIGFRYESHSDRANADTETQVEDIDETFRENSISGIFNNISKITFKWRRTL